MVKTLVSDFNATSVYALNIDKLVDANIKLAFIDLDNTLARYDIYTPEKRTFELIKAFQKKGIEVVIISNNTAKRVAGYVNKLKVPYIASTHKPWKGKLKRYLISNCIDKSNAIIIGDQVLTDALLAKHLDMKLVLVEPLTNKDNLITKFNRLIERPLRKKYKRENRLGINITSKEA